MEEVELQLKEFIEAGLAPNTRKAYHTGQNAWAAFCALNEDCEPLLEGAGLEEELAAEKQLMRFAAFLAPFIKLVTIRAYISGVRSLHVERLGYVMWESGKRLPQLLKGIGRKYPASVRKRAPVSVEVDQAAGYEKKFTPGAVGGDLAGVLRTHAQVGVFGPSRSGV